jgi:hypothetical protein
MRVPVKTPLSWQLCYCQGHATATHRTHVVCQHSQEHPLSLHRRSAGWCTKTSSFKFVRACLMADRSLSALLKTLACVGTTTSVIADATERENVTTAPLIQRVTFQYDQSVTLNLRFSKHASHPPAPETHIHDHALHFMHPT